eukprot:CAMPEP_0197648334 /NCGR_PEP_ID=MMETSP1338-20131121/27692_1 /TAXON_ID=43686 ORGANISM="Pelagodinium beii, Strain RCC1491" /NCGR_SAMPLE_ID=MMETSP1338 /ASSEMBLY_ACC=CAM_ASM_000754 /LENGTH=66 /DNA_ID=CAMNT_0043222313 /DNA_START=184 /DNA_END=387 /DNA_ORIENTATION=+
MSILQYSRLQFAQQQKPPFFFLLDFFLGAAVLELFEAPLASGTGAGSGSTIGIGMASGAAGGIMLP